jgi:threonine dehydratase
VRFFTRVADRPGGLAALLAAVAEAGANVLGVDHVRDGVPLGPRETGLDVTAEIRSAGHAHELVATLRTAGYDVTVHT